MKLRNNTSYKPGRLGRLLSRRDWAYVLALLVPFVAYDLALKIVRVASLSDEHGLLGSLQLVRSDLLFNLGYALLWVGLFAVAKEGLWRALVGGLFHAATILLALIATGAHRFYEVTGSTLDFDVILFFLSSPGEVWAVAASEVTPLLVVAVLAALLYAVLGPWLLARLVARRGRSTGRGAARLGITQRGFAALCAAALALFSLSRSCRAGLRRTRASPPPTRANRSLGRHS